jgi:hypothetical protein
MFTRSYLSQMFSGTKRIDEAVFTAYAKLLEQGLFGTCEQGEASG